jgi:hypothetical protein
MPPSPVATIALLILLAWSATLAHADGGSDAVEELKRGYALKQQGDCREAVSHFERSATLAPTPKALLNLSDCEQRLGDLVGARGHAAAGERLARQQNLGELDKVADEQIAAIDKRLAWLTLRLAVGAPADCAVRRDDAAVAPALLGVPVAINAGPHSIAVAAPHRAARTIGLTLTEGEHAQLEVAPGPPDWSAVPSLPAFAALGAGVAGLTIGVALGMEAGSKHGMLVRECDPSGLCPESSRPDLDAFRSLKTWSSVGYVVGGVGLAAGAALWFVLPRVAPAASASHAWVGPGSAGLAGDF